MALGLNAGKIRLNSGDGDQVKLTTWQKIGHCESGTINDTQDSAEATTKAGLTIERAAKEKCNVEMALLQSGKDEIDLADDIGEAAIPLYLDNGIVDGKYQMFYFPEVVCIKNLKIEMKGQTFQQVGVKFTALPQSSLASVSSANLPADSPAYSVADAVVTYTGKNRYFVCIEIAVTAELVTLMTKLANPNLSDAQKDSIRASIKKEFDAMKAAVTNTNTDGTVTTAKASDSKK